METLKHKPYLDRRPDPVTSGEENTMLHPINIFDPQKLINYLVRIIDDLKQKMDDDDLTDVGIAHLAGKREAYEHMLSVLKQER